MRWRTGRSPYKLARGKGCEKHAFCETNRIGLGVVFDVTIVPQAGCADNTEKTNPVRLEQTNPFWGAVLPPLTISNGHDGAWPSKHHTLGFDRYFFGGRRRIGKWT